MSTVSVANPKNLYTPINNSNSLAERNSRFKFLNTVAKAVTVKVYVGEDRVSGVLIDTNFANKTNTYTVVSNSNIVNRGNTYRIETSDGVMHKVSRSNQDSVLGIGGDFLILQFESTNTYKRALLDNDRVGNVEEGETVIAAGFPDNRGDLLISQGKISLLLDKPLEKGYQIGFSNETVQGMSGGVLLDSKGVIIGVIGKGKGALINNSYQYQDGTSLSAEGIKKVQNVGLAIPTASLDWWEIINLYSRKDLENETPKSVDQAEAEVALLPSETQINIANFQKNYPKIDEIAEQITVRIDTVSNLKQKSNGSGVIIAKQGKTYYGITAKHVLCESSNKPRCQFNGTHQIVTADGKKHRLNNRTIVKSKGSDLAIFSFDSDRNYQVATLGNYSLDGIDPGVFVSGFPNVKENPDLQRAITIGHIHQSKKESLVKDSYSLADKGQGLLYTNVSYGGMSGGAVLDADGNLVGINTGVEGENLIDEAGSSQDLILGFSLGIPTQDIFNFLETETSIKAKWLDKTQNLPETIDINSAWIVEDNQPLDIPQKPKDDKDLAGWMNYGNQLWRFGKNLEAIAVFEKVSTLDPDFEQAYYAMGLAYYSEYQMKLASRAFAKATELNPNHHYYWRYLALSLLESKEYDRAVIAYEQAIQKNQSEADSKINFVLYSEYANLLRSSGSYQKSLNAYDRAIAINPYKFSLYLERGFVYRELNQYRKALADYDRVLEILAEDKTVQADSIQYVMAYRERGFVHERLKQYKKALADYKEAIAIDPKHADTYYYRGILYTGLKQYEKALADYNQAIELNPQDFESYYNRGFIYTELKQYKKALADYNQTFKINPNAANAYKKSGVIHALFGDFAKAKENVKEAARLHQEQKNAQEYQEALQVLEMIKLEEKKQNSN